jgi:hypothetical protein
MDAYPPLQRTIVRVGGVLEALHTKPQISEYVGFLEFDDGSIAELREGSLELVSSWPEQLDEIPIQSLARDARLAGRTVTNVIIREARNDVGRDGKPQLFLILDGELLFGLVPTQLGTVLHVEPLLTSPLITRRYSLTTLSGEPVSLADLVVS